VGRGQAQQGQLILPGLIPESFKEIDELHAAIIAGCGFPHGSQNFAGLDGAHFGEEASTYFLYQALTGTKERIWNERDKKTGELRGPSWASKFGTVTDKPVRVFVIVPTSMLSATKIVVKPPPAAPGRRHGPAEAEV